MQLNFSGELKANLYANLTKNLGQIYSKLKNRLILRLQSSFGISVSFGSSLQTSCLSSKNIADL